VSLPQPVSAGNFWRDGWKPTLPPTTRLRLDFYFFALKERTRVTFTSKLFMVFEREKNRTRCAGISPLLQRLGLGCVRYEPSGSINLSTVREPICTEARTVLTDSVIRNFFDASSRSKWYVHQTQRGKAWCTPKVQFSFSSNVSHSII
jgi:hypothetical protein